VEFWRACRGPFGSNVNTDQSEVNGSPRCAVRQENTVEDTNSRDSAGGRCAVLSEVPALSLVRITSRQAGATPPRKLAQTRERGAVAS